MAISEVNAMRQTKFIMSRFAAAGILVSSAILLTSCSTLFPKEEAALTVPLVTPAAIEYKTQAVTKGSIVNQVKMTGKVIASVEQSLYFTADSSRLTAINVAAGDAVKKGDVLASSDTGNLDYQINMQKLEVQKAELQYNALPDGTTEKSIAGLTLDQQKLQLQQLRKQKADTEIEAPYDGVITYVNKTALGENVPAYTTVITIADPTTRILVSDTTVTEPISVGAAADVTLRDNTTTTAEVMETPDTIADDSKYVNCTFFSITGDVPDGLKIGSTVDITYITAEEDNVIVIPKKYIVSTNNRKYVSVLVDGLRTEKDVTVGITNDTDAEILTGLSEGDLLILN